jgi:NAD(P)-dependent dehydrogenase (short-subunit alcohol dehydrogenase family)
MTELAGKVAHVTAAGAGIGRGIARHLARAGASVAVSDTDEEWGAGTVELITQAGGHAVFTRADATVEHEIRGALELTQETFGPLDVLVLNAGGVPGASFPEGEPSAWLGNVALNLQSAMLGAYHGIAAMKRHGGGAILFVSSMAGIGFVPHPAPEYAACKAALCRLTPALAPLAFEHRIRVNCICPDWVATELLLGRRAAMGEERWLAHAPAELVPVDDIAAAALRMILDDALAGRVLLCPVGDWDWGLVPPDDAPGVEPLPGLRRRRS